jgi:hypothetical protein
MIDSNGKSKSDDSLLKYLIKLKLKCICLFISIMILGISIKPVDITSEIGIP